MRVLFIIILAALCVGTPALGQKDTLTPAASDQLDIRICNESGRDVFTAVAFRTGGRWRSAGWFRVNNRACSTIATSDNLRFYVFAETVGDSNRYWGGNFRYCVTRPGPYGFWVDPNSSTCLAGQESLMFRELQAGQFGTFTWTLDP